MGTNASREVVIQDDETTGSNPNITSESTENEAQYPRILFATGSSSSQISNVTYSLCRCTYLSVLEDTLNATERGLPTFADHCVDLTQWQYQNQIDRVTDDTSVPENVRHRLKNICSEATENSTNSR